MALRVLRFNAPELVGDFADGLIQLGKRSHVERIRAPDLSALPTWASRLSDEDQQVLADSLEGQARFLLTHDSEFFRLPSPEISVKAPSDFLWHPNDPHILQGDPLAWTFIGQFWPNWSTEAMRHSSESIYVLDLTGKAEFVYEPTRAAFVFRWFEDSALAGVLELPQEIDWRSPNFVAAAVDETGVFVFANGETRGRDVPVGPVPRGSRIYPFNNSRGGGQINGHCQFRLAKGRMTERRIRRLWRCRSLELSDGELRFHELASTTRTLIERGR